MVGRFDTANVKYNLIGSGNSILDLLGVPVSTLDPTNLHSTNLTLNNSTLLGLLQNNGGPTPTHALLSGSEAIDMGSDTYAEDPSTHVQFTSDQRGTGFTRFYDILGVGVNGGFPAPVDIGAYEIQLPKVIDVILDDIDPSTNTSLWGLGQISYAKLETLHQQLAPVYRYGTNTIKIAFSEELTTYSASIYDFWQRR